jgi:glutamate 5-kinase
MNKIVVKVGSSVIAPGGKLDSRLITRMVSDFLEAEKKGYKIILVSSGAIACGLDKFGYKRKPQDIHSLMALSSLGQILLMDIYADKFKKYKKLCAQILLTWDDFDNRKRFLNARLTIDKLLSMGIIPIINENDAVSFEEIKFGENDRLAALVADLVSAQMLIVLSDVEGLIKEDKVVKVVPKIDTEVFRLVKKSADNFTAGGMSSKLEAAGVAVSSGIKTVIAKGRENKVISRLLKGEELGTVFLPSKKVGQARKRWIAFSKKAKGRVYVDAGAAAAILNKGRSLLSVGIVKVEGDFKRKDAVEVLDEKGIVCGCGLINYSCEEMIDLKGKKFDKEIIHRDNFVKKEA